MANWHFDTQNVKCPLCGESCTGLDWVLDADDTTTGAKVFPCADVVPMPPYTFGHTGADGTLRFTKIEK